MGLSTEQREELRKSYSKYFRSLSDKELLKEYKAVVVDDGNGNFIISLLCRADECEFEVIRRGLW